MRFIRRIALRFCMGPSRPISRDNVRAPLANASRVAELAKAPYERELPLVCPFDKEEDLGPQAA